MICHNCAFVLICIHVAGGELARQFTEIWEQREKLRVKLQEEVQKTKALSYQNFELLKPIL